MSSVCFHDSWCHVRTEQWPSESMECNKKVRSNLGKLFLRSAAQVFNDMINQGGPIKALFSVVSLYVCSR